MSIVLYTTHCPQCKVLKAKLDQKGIQYEQNDDIDEMLSLGYHTAPLLKLEDGQILNFTAARNWIKEQ